MTSLLHILPAKFSAWTKEEAIDCWDENIAVESVA